MKDILSSGKTTLLDVLADRISRGTIEGEIRVNGRPRGKSFKHYASYVQQEDTLYGTMTVRETFEFVAALTRKREATNEQEGKRIEDTIRVCSFYLFSIGKKINDLLS